MASVSAALTLKLVAVTTVLALLVIPTLGRCPSLGPAPPPAAQAPPPPRGAIPTTTTTGEGATTTTDGDTASACAGPGLGPRLGCGECRVQCFPACEASHSMDFKEECDNDESRCEQCRTPVIEKCTAVCTGSCDCNAEADKSCTSECSYNTCSYCGYSRGKSCKNDCDNYCNSNCWGP